MWGPFSDLENLLKIKREIKLDYIFYILTFWRTQLKTVFSCLSISSRETSRQRDPWQALCYLPVAGWWQPLQGARRPDRVRPHCLAGAWGAVLLSVTLAGFLQAKQEDIEPFLRPARPWESLARCWRAQLRPRWERLCVVSPRLFAKQRAWDADQHRTA